MTNKDFTKLTEALKALEDIAIIWIRNGYYGQAQELLDQINGIKYNTKYIVKSETGKLGETND